MAASDGKVKQAMEKDSEKETRILLIGKAGHGKSATGNAILGCKMFETSVGSRVINKTSERRSARRFGRRLVVVDTPELLDTDKYSEKTAREVAKILGHVHTGFHAMIYVMGAAKFTDACVETRDLYFKVFGEEVAKYTIIVITHLDLLLQESFDPDDYLSLTAKEFRNMQKQCGQRVVFIDNKASEREMGRQAKQIIDLVDKLDKTNDVPIFTNLYTRLVHAYLQLEELPESSDLDPAKRELCRRAARLTGTKFPLPWNSEKQVPVQRPSNLNLLAVPAEVSRKGSHPDIRPLDLARHPHRPLPEARPNLFRRYSLGTVEMSSLSMPGRSNSVDVIKEDSDITDIIDEPVDGLDDNVRAILDQIDATDNLDSPDNHPKSSHTPVKDIDFQRKVDDKIALDRFLNFFSYFLTPIVNVKKGLKK